MIKAILFDKDGTLIEFNSTMHSIYCNVLIYLKAQYAIPDSLVNELYSTLGILPDRLSPDSLLQFSTNPQIAEAIIAPCEKHAEQCTSELSFGKTELLKIIEDLSLDDTVPYTALPYVLETLEYLRTKDYKLGIATADTLAGTIASLEKTDMLEYFHYIGTADEDKPKPDSLLADNFCTQFKIQPNELLVVGDSKNDMLFAENAGAHFVGIDLPDSSYSVFRSSNCKSISNMGDIIDMFDL